MAYVNTTRTMESSRFAGKLSALIAEFRLALNRRAVYRQTFNELTALSDRELNDLGLDRSELRSIALDAAYGA